MVNYTSSANLGGGSFAPSVQYNTPVRMPTQPMPDMPDVRSEFNIDLRPVGQAILGVEELKVKSELAEKEMELKRDLAAQEHLRNMAIKQAEWEMKERHHNDDMLYKYAKLQKDDKDNTLKNAELNRAIDSYMKGLDVLEADLKQEKIDYNGYETDKRALFDRIASTLQYNNVGTFSDTANKLRPGSGGLQSAWMSDFQATQEKARNTSAELEANNISNIKNTLNVSTAEATERFGNTRQAYIKASEILSNIDNIPSMVREDQRDSYIRAQQEAADRELGIIGAGKVIYDLNKNINKIHRMQNPAEGVELLRQSFYQSMAGLNVPATRIETLWNIYKDTNNLEKLIENVNGLSKDISDSQKLFITRAVEQKQVELIKDPYMGNLILTVEAVPFLKKAIEQNPQHFTKIMEISNAVFNASMVNAEPDGDNWKVTLADGSVMRLSGEDATQILTATNQQDLTTALLTLSLQTGARAKNTGDMERAGVVSSNVLNNVKSQKPANSEENIKRIKNMDTVLKEMPDVRYLDGQKEDVVLKSSHYKLLGRYGQQGFVDVSGKINYLVPDTVWSNKLKGGKLFVFPKSDGTLGLHREQFGALGGLGRRSFNDKAKEVSKMMADAGLTVEEQITVVRAALNDNTELFEIKEKDWEPSLLDRVKTFAQAIPGEVIDIGAEIDTEVAGFLVMLSRARSMRDVDLILNMVAKDAKNFIKEKLENIKNNDAFPGLIREGADELLNTEYLWKDGKPFKDSKNYFNATQSVEPSKQDYREPVKTEQKTTLSNAADEHEKIASGVEVGWFKYDDTYVIQENGEFYKIRSDGDEKPFKDIYKDFKDGKLEIEGVADSLQGLFNNNNKGNATIGKTPKSNPLKIGIGFKKVTDLNDKEELYENNGQYFVVLKDLPLEEKNAELNRQFKNANSGEIIGVTVD